MRAVSRMQTDASSQGLRAVSQETNDAWHHFISLFRRDCVYEGPQKSHELLPARLELVNEQLFAISHSPGGVEEQISLVISHPHANISQDVAVVGSFHQVGLRSTQNPTGVEPFVKLELSDQIQLHPRPYPVSDFQENLPYLDGNWIGSRSALVESASESPVTKRCRVCGPGYIANDRTHLTEGADSLRNRAGAESEESSHGASHAISHMSLCMPLQSQSPESIPPSGRRTRPVSKNKMLKFDRLKHWKQFEEKELAKISSLKMDNQRDHTLDLPSISFEHLLRTRKNGDGVSTERPISEEEAHTIVSFVTAVAGPESLIQFKQAMIGWRTRSLTTELMKSNEFVPVLKALHHLEAQNAFNAIATRIKLVQLAAAVDVANLTLPAPKGRGNPIVIWLSHQYKVFLHAEYPEMTEGSTMWNMKLDDIKRKVKAGRRWQHLIKLFGTGVVGLVPSFATGDSRNYDFNKGIKTYKDHCFKLIADTLELRKGHHVRLLSSKLHEFMERLFKGHTDFPRLVLEYMDTSQIEAQPNCSPELSIYLDIATKALCLPSVSPAMIGGPIDFGNSDLVKSALDRLGLREENLEEFKGNNKMSGSVINSFMKMLTAEAKGTPMQKETLFMDSDFFPGANRCLSCRSQDQFCDMADQQGAHCTRCRCDGIICERPKRRGILDEDNLYRYDRVFIPIFTKEITHWSLVVIQPADRSIVHYDSLDYPGPDRPAILTWALREVVKWVKDLISVNWGNHGWQAVSFSVAKQPPGGNDCGICTVMFCRLLQAGQPLPEHGSFVPRLMAQIRTDLAKQLIEGRFNRDISMLEGV